MKQTDTRDDAPLRRFLKPAREARLRHREEAFRRADLSRGLGSGGILAVPSRDPDRDRAEALVFGRRRDD